MSIYEEDLNHFKQVLNANNYPKNDFEVREEELMLCGKTLLEGLALAQLEDSVIVTRLSTSKVKQYKSGSDSHWVYDFLVDLQKGMFN